MSAFFDRADREGLTRDGPCPSVFLPRESVRRILVCQLRQIGDVLLATPSLELLARHYPTAELHMFTEKKCLPMLQGNPGIHRLWPVDKKALPSLVHELLFYRRVADSGFDLVVDFQQLPRCRWVVGFSRARVRLSFSPPWYLRFLYTHWSQPEPGYAGAYKAGVLAPLGICWQGERPRLYLDEEEETAAHTLLERAGLADKKFVSVDVTHRHSTRRWPPGHFAGLIDMAAEVWPHLHFFLPYGPGEENDVRMLHELCRCKKRMIIPPDVLDLRLMAACIKRSAMHLGNCSAPRHIAVAVDTPSFTILGATGRGWTFPSPEHADIQGKAFFDMPCQHCNKNICPNAREAPCLDRLTPDLVFHPFMNHMRQYAKGLS
jgi:heptosyltransferase-2/heptosyltransferase-3